MDLPKFKNLEITEITENILLVHQIKSSAMFTRCDGLILLPNEGRNKDTVILDLNLEPNYVKEIYDRYSPVSDYVCTHTHLDHSAHVYVWEELGVKIHAPIKEYENLHDLQTFIDKFSFLEYVSPESAKMFADAMGFHPCKNVSLLEPGTTLKFDNLEVETILFSGHSPGHIGFFIPSDKVLHISCLGFDQPKPGIDGFGPWYGFKPNVISQYFDDIAKAEKIFMERARLLTSSHSYIVKHPDPTPFEYMRNKIEHNQIIVDQAIKSLKTLIDTDGIIKDLLELDLFFPKKKMKGFMKDIYTLWEHWIIEKHVARSTLLQ